MHHHNFNFFYSRDVKASGIYFVIYHWTLDFFSSRRETENAKKSLDDSNSAAEIFVAGGLAGFSLFVYYFQTAN